MDLLNKIDFGIPSDARDEALAKPDFFRDSYLDQNELVEKAVRGREFVVLGPKGSGKTALAQIIRLRAAENNEALQVEVSDLSNFPYSSFHAVIPTTTEKNDYPQTWSWLLLMKLLSMQRADPHLDRPHNITYLETTDKLVRLGLVSAPTLGDLVNRTMTEGWELEVPKILKVKQKPNEQISKIHFLNIIQHLKELVSRYSSHSRFVLILDGLDKVLSYEAAQFDTLTALVAAVKDLNLYFEERKCNAKVLLLCRNELFAKLRAPDLNKIRQGSTIQIKWYHPAHPADKSPLIDLINRKAATHLGYSINVINSFFPGNRTSGGEMWAEYLIKQTRYTPRDILTLFNDYLKRHYSTVKMSAQHVRAALDDYSTEYFRPEIEDELVGYCGERVSERGFKLLSQVGRQRIKCSDLMDVPRDGLTNTDLLEFLKVLSECGAVGIRNKSQQRYMFQAENPNQELNSGSWVEIHRGLWANLGLV
jgi:Cdc6-like AAA superfamily ATPase